MKKLVLLAALSFIFTLNAFAQDKGAVNPSTAAVQKPPAAAAKTPVAAVKQPTARTIFSYQKELGLTDKQVQNLKDKAADFQIYLVEQEKAFLALQKEFNAMISSRADLKLIRKKLEDTSRIQVDIAFKRIETFRKIEDELTSAQLSKWKSIQLEARKELQKKQQEAQKAKAPGK